MTMMTEEAVGRQCCGVCGRPGHKRQTCPDAPGPTFALVRSEPAPVARVDDDPVARIAELRERFDAIGAEIEQYERVRTELELRISDGNRKRADLAVEIKRLRQGR